jgi:hypothetical protein
MNNVKIFLNERGYYQRESGSTIKMSLLAGLFVDDVGCNRASFKEWADTASDGDCFSGNITNLELEGDDIVMTDLYPEVPAEVRMTRHQFVKLFDEWQEKVCKNRPRELFIIHDNDEYFIKVTNQ